MLYKKLSTLSQKQIAYPLLLIVLIILSLLINFDQIVWNFGTRLVGGQTNGAGALWHTWWPQYSFRVPDGVAIHAYTTAPFLTNHLAYVPLFQSLLFGTLAFLRNPVLVFNLLLVITQIATFLSIFWLLHFNRAPYALAAISAAAFILSPAYSSLIDQANIIQASLWMLPLALIAWDYWLAEPSYLRALLIVAILYLGVLSGIQHLSWIILLWVPFAYQKIKQVEITRALRDQLSFAILLFLCLFLIYPVPTLVRTYLGNEPAFSPSSSTLPVLLSMVGILRRSGPVIWLFLLSALLFTDREKRLNLWLILTGIFFAIGIALIPEPSRMIALALEAPGQSLFPREMFVNIALFTAMIYACLAWNDSWMELKGAFRWAGGIAALALILISNPATYKPVAQHDLPPHPFYSLIEKEEEDYLLLTYPFGLQTEDRQIGEGAFLTQYAVWHHKRTLSGIAPFYEQEVFDAYEAMFFLHPESLTPGEFSTAAEQLEQAVNQWRIGYVVIHSEAVDEDMVSTIEVLADQSDALCPPVKQGSLVFFRAKWHPLGCTLQ